MALLKDSYMADTHTQKTSDYAIDCYREHYVLSDGDNKVVEKERKKETDWLKHILHNLT